MNISSGKIVSAQKIVVYGPEGIGKSTFAAQFPDPIFIDTEGSTKHMDVRRFDKPSSWTMLLEQVKYVKSNPSVCKTLVVDTADWAEILCANDVCARAKKTSIEDFGYGKGYAYLQEEFGRLLNLLEEIISLKINVVVTAHAKMRKFEQPDELGAYDRWEMKLTKQVAPLVKEWADLVLFANYKTYVIKINDNKSKASGGARVMYTSHHPCWDAKNRHGLNDELPFDYAEIAHIFSRTVNTQVPLIAEPEKITIPQDLNIEKIDDSIPQISDAEQKSDNKKIVSVCFEQLDDLMKSTDIKEDELRQVVWERGYYPLDTPINKYDPEFVAGVLVAAWDQVCAMILNNRENIPF